MSLYRLRNIIIALLLIIAAFVLQSAVFSKIQILGCAPNLLLILTFVYGYTKDKISGMLMGLFSGLLLDTFSCDVIGYNALILLIIGFISGIWSSYFYSDDLYVPLLLILGSELLYCLLYYVFWFLLRAKFEFGYYLIHVILPEFLLTIIAGVILYKPLALLNEKLSIVSEQ